MGLNRKIRIQFGLLIASNNYLTHSAHLICSSREASCFNKTPIMIIITIFYRMWSFSNSLDYIHFETGRASFLSLSSKHCYIIIATPFILQLPITLNMIVVFSWSFLVLYILNMRPQVVFFEFINSPQSRGTIQVYTGEINWPLHIFNHYNDLWLFFSNLILVDKLNSFSRSFFKVYQRHDCIFSLSVLTHIKNGKPRIRMNRSPSVRLT